MPEQGLFVDVMGFGSVSSSSTSSGPVSASIHFIIRVKQDGFQEWAVYRDYASFQTLEFQVSTLYYGADSLPSIDSRVTSHDALLTSKDLLNEWLLHLLDLSEILNTQFIYQFLCSNANLPPSQFKTIYPTTSLPTHWHVNDDEDNLDITYHYEYEGKEDDGKEDGKHDGYSRSYERCTFDEKDIESLSTGKVTLLYNNSETLGTQNILPSINLSSFTISRVLGKGNFGKVFLCTFKEINKQFAMKVLSKQSIKQKQQTDHTLTEKDILTRVRHPFIVDLAMTFQTREKLFFILEYCSGGELFRRLCKVGRFNESHSKFYTGQIILALSHVHSYHYIYRDLKPENVLLDERGNVKLSDFGLSKRGVTSAVSGGSTFCGTPEYIAPEVLLGHDYGKAVDWWAVGAMYYEMVAGAPPFYSRNKSIMFQRIVQCDVVYPKFMSEAAVDFLAKIFVLEADQRLGSAEGDAAGLKDHQLFHGMDWRGLLAGEMEPPWKPEAEPLGHHSDHHDIQPGLSLESLHSLSRMEQSYDSTFASFDYLDNSTLYNSSSSSADVSREYTYRYDPSECKYIRDDRGFEVSPRGFLASWLSTAKKLILPKGSKAIVSRKV